MISHPPPDITCGYGEKKVKPPVSSTAVLLFPISFILKVAVEVYHPLASFVVCLDAWRFVS